MHGVMLGGHSEVLWSCPHLPGGVLIYVFESLRYDVLLRVLITKRYGSWNGQKNMRHGPEGYVDGDGGREAVNMKILCTLVVCRYMNVVLCHRALVMALTYPAIDSALVNYVVLAGQSQTLLV